MTWSQCKKAVKRLKEDPIIISYELYRSPRGNGYHVRVFCLKDVNNARYRVKYGDDPYRLINDLCNRDPMVHNILWRIKTVKGIRYIERHIETWNRNIS